ncbi:unnamed protein product [Prunus brigantina]
MSFTFSRIRWSRDLTGLALVPTEMAELMKKDAEAPLCFQSGSALASHSWISKNPSRSFPSSEVRNSPVKWADWIDRLLPRYGAHWRRAGIYDVILRPSQVNQ